MRDPTSSRSPSGGRGVAVTRLPPGGRRLLRTFAACLLAAPALVGVARAHVTPPVTLVPEREAVSHLVAARKLSAREVRLTSAERSTIERRSGWKPAAGSHRVYVGLDGDGGLAGAVVVLSDYSMHGPVRVAVGLDPEGRVTGATVVEVGEEAYGWIRPLVDADFVRDYLGRDARGPFAPTDRLERAAPGTMPRFYARVLTSLLGRAALLYEVGFLARGATG